MAGRRDGAAAAGFFLNVLMAMAFATIGFWTTQAGNLYSLWWGIGAFLSGWIAPLALVAGRRSRRGPGAAVPILDGLSARDHAQPAVTGGEIVKGFAVTWYLDRGLRHSLPVWVAEREFAGIRRSADEALPADC